MRLESLQSLTSVLKDSEFLVSRKLFFTMRNSLRLLEAFRPVALWYRNLLLLSLISKFFFFTRIHGTEIFLPIFNSSSLVLWINSISSVWLRPSPKSVIVMAEYEQECFQLPFQPLLLNPT